MPRLAETIFRAYDIRGVYRDTLTLEDARLIGKAIGSEVLAQGQDKVALARDGRLSGPDLSRALSEGILATGCGVVATGMVPTPLLYFATHFFTDLNSGVMVTGSHNPADYNGFKIVINGVTLSGDAIQALRRRAETGDFFEGQGQYEDRDVWHPYLDAFCKTNSLTRPLKVVVDCGNGVAGVIAPEAIEALGCEVVPLYVEVDGHFPNHHPDPGDPDNLQDLIRHVKQEGADLGLAFDGDGDRVGVVTPSGRIVYPDILLMALAEDLLERCPGARVLFDVKCTSSLFDVIRQAGGVPEMSRTGHSLIKARMQESGAMLAGEMSGHIFFSENWYGFDDAFVAAARLLGMIAREEGGVEKIIERYPDKCSTPEITIPVTDENKFEIIRYLQESTELGDGTRCTIDGIRVDYSDGWGLCRASNTSPKLVTRYEADDQLSLDRIKSLFEDAITAAIRAVG